MFVQDSVVFLHNWETFYIITILYLPRAVSTDYIKHLNEIKFSITDYLRNYRWNIIHADYPEVQYSIRRWKAPHNAW